MRTCVWCAQRHCTTPSRYLLGWSGLYGDLTSFVGHQVWALEIGCRGVLWVANLNHPTKRRNKPRAGRRSQLSIQGHEIGAAQAPARTHSVPSPADSPISITPKLFQRAIK